MLTREDIEELGFFYYGESTNHQSSIGTSYDKLQNIKAYSIKLIDDSYCHIHFFDDKDDSIYIDEIETTDMYGGADNPFAGYREGGCGPSMRSGLRIISKEYLLIALDILGVMGSNYDNRCILSK